MINWKKLGLIFNPYEYLSRNEKLLTHASNPLAVKIESNIYRIFYSSRDANNRSSVGGFDFDIDKLKVIHNFELPFFCYGNSESYYSAGVSIGSYYENSNGKFILFMAWQNPEGQHWRGDIGRLRINQNYEFTLDNQSPYMTIDKKFDKVSLSYPWVSKDSSGNYEMFYGSTITWKEENGEMIHVINKAESSDGEIWLRTGMALPYKLNYYQAFSRPTHQYVSNDFQRMWFSYRSGTGQKYRIGYAEKDNREWSILNDKSGIDVSPSGWDSEMIEYPFVFNHDGRNFMLYNGNGYGKSGIGLAVEKI